ncbi:MAG: hypothetical protein ABI886_08505, partial [Betaproteobacteria bacterium]
DEPATATLTRIARTLAVAVLTTAAAAVALLLAGFPGLAQLGLLTMVGVLGAGAVTAWVLPSWVPQGRHAAPIAAAMRVPRALPSPAVRISIAAALAIAVLFAAMVRPWWDDDLAHMNPLPKELMQRDGELRAALGAPDVRWMLFVDGATQEEALASAEKVRPILMQAVAAGTLRGFELVSDYLPSNATQRARRAALPASAQLRANLTEAARGLPLRVEAFLPFLDAVERARTAPPVTADDLAGTAIGLKLDGLLRHEGARWYVVVPLTGVLDAAAVENAVAQGGGAAVRWVDLQATSRTMMAEFRERALTAFGVGAILIAAVLVVGLRSVFAAARVLLPVTVAIGVTAAAMVAIGSPLTVFHLVALMLVAGIGTNYALFLARAASVDDPASTTFRSLAVVGSTTLCAFGTLASSQAPALRAIGLTVSLGVIASLVFAVLLWTGHIYPARRA